MVKYGFSCTHFIDLKKMLWNTFNIKTHLFRISFLSQSLDLMKQSINGLQWASTGLF